MFKSKDLIYIRFHKTGSTHITRLLKDLFDGETIPGHLAASAKQIRNVRHIISSIRSPWEWYLSLWSYGCQSRGALWHRLTHEHAVRSIMEAHATHQKTERQRPKRIKAICDSWRNLYSDSSRQDLFRKWLKKIHRPQNSIFMGEGYGDTQAKDHWGFMTYRYLSLCCKSPWRLKKSGLFDSYAGLEAYDRENCYVENFINQDRLADSFCEVIDPIRPLTPSEKKKIFGTGKSNTSKRPHDSVQYYDPQTIKLVYRRDRLLIEKFKYVAPC